jgi:hypothetical protein
MKMSQYIAQLCSATRILLLVLVLRGLVQTIPIV